MAEKKPVTKRPSQSETQIIGFRLPKALAAAVKTEAARRGLPLNTLFAELWELYERAGTPRKD